MRADNSMDLDDLLGLTVALFESCPDVLAKVAAAYDGVYVDEFQDVNPAQYALIKLLLRQMGPKARLFAVGDVNQAIYEWRGAAPQLMEQLDTGRPVHTRPWPPQSECMCPA